MNTEEIIAKMRAFPGVWAPYNHEPTDGRGCVMEIVSWAAGAPWGAFPPCVPFEVSRLCQAIHDYADPAEYAEIWTDAKLRAVLSAAHGDRAERTRGFIAAEHARAEVVRILRAIGDDTRAVDALPPVTDSQSALALRDALRAVPTTLDTRNWRYAAFYAADAAHAASVANAPRAAEAADAVHVYGGGPDSVAAHTVYAHRQRGRLALLDAWCAVGAE